MKFKENKRDFKNDVINAINESIEYKNGNTCVLVLGVKGSKASLRYYAQDNETEKPVELASLLKMICN